MEILQLVGKLPGRRITLGVTACAWRYGVGVSSFQITCDLTLGSLSLADCRNVRLLVSVPRKRSACIDAWGRSPLISTQR